jgi:tRNA G37 N-methylase Trm5
MELILKNVKKKIYHFKIVGKIIGFEIEKENKPYNPEFVKEILRPRKKLERKGIRMTMEELKDLCK